MLKIAAAKDFEVSRTNIKSVTVFLKNSQVVYMKVLTREKSLVSSGEAEVQFSLPITVLIEVLTGNPWHCVR